jgi:hypothetical protein
MEAAVKVHGVVVLPGSNNPNKGLKIKEAGVCGTKVVVKEEAQEVEVAIMPGDDNRATRYAINLMLFEQSFFLSVHF